MQRVQRITGRFLPRTPNEADVDAMLKDFTDSKAMLEKVEACAKQWRDAWTNILNHQLATVDHLYTIFKPLGGEGTTAHAAAETPQATLERVHGLHATFAELKTDMMEEVKDIDRKLVVPAKLARDALKPMEKAIKKREDAKVRRTLLFFHGLSLTVPRTGRLRALQEPLRGPTEEDNPFRAREPRPDQARSRPRALHGRLSV